MRVLARKHLLPLPLAGGLDFAARAFGHRRKTGPPLSVGGSRVCMGVVVHLLGAPLDPDKGMGLQEMLVALGVAVVPYEHPVPACVLWPSSSAQD